MLLSVVLSLKASVRRVMGVVITIPVINRKFFLVRPLTEGPQQQRPESPTITGTRYTHSTVHLLGGVYVPCMYRMPGGVIVGDSGLCCCGPACNAIGDVNCSSVITSHCLLSIQKRSKASFCFRLS